MAATRGFAGWPAHLLFLSPVWGRTIGHGTFYGDTQGADSLLRVWKARDGSALYNIPPNEQNFSFSLSEDGSLLLAVPEENPPAVEPIFNFKVFSAVYDARTGAKLWTLPSDGYGLFAPAQRDLWVLREQRTRNDKLIEQVEVRDAKTGRMRSHFTLPGRFGDSAASYVRRRNGNAFALLQSERGADLWSISERGVTRKRNSIRSESSASDPTLSPDERYLSFLCGDGDHQRLLVWNLRRWRLEFQSPVLPGGIWGTVSWSRDSRFLAFAANMNSGVYLWRFDAPTPPRRAHIAAPGYNCAAAFWPDNKRLLIGDEKGVRTLSLSQFFP